MTVLEPQLRECIVRRQHGRAQNASGTTHFGFAVRVNCRNRNWGDSLSTILHLANLLESEIYLPPMAARTYRALTTCLESFNLQLEACQGWFTIWILTMIRCSVGFGQPGRMRKQSTALPRPELYCDKMERLAEVSHRSLGHQSQKPQSC